MGAVYDQIASGFGTPDLSVGNIVSTLLTYDTSGPMGRPDMRWQAQEFGAAATAAGIKGPFGIYDVAGYGRNDGYIDLNSVVAAARYAADSNGRISHDAYHVFGMVPPETGTGTGAGTGTGGAVGTPGGHAHGGGASHAHYTPAYSNYTPYGYYASPYAGSYSGYADPSSQGAYGYPNQAYASYGSHGGHDMGSALGGMLGQNGSVSLMPGMGSGAPHPVYGRPVSPFPGGSDGMMSLGDLIDLAIGYDANYGATGAPGGCPMPGHSGGHAGGGHGMPMPGMPMPGAPMPGAPMPGSPGMPPVGGGHGHGPGAGGNHAHYAGMPTPGGTAGGGHAHGGGAGGMTGGYTLPPNFNNAPQTYIDPMEWSRMSSQIGFQANDLNWIDGVAGTPRDGRIDMNELGVLYGMAGATDPAGLNADQLYQWREAAFDAVNPAYYGHSGAPFGTPAMPVGNYWPQMPQPYAPQQPGTMTNGTYFPSYGDPMIHDPMAHGDDPFTNPYRPGSAMLC